MPNAAIPIVIVGFRNPGDICGCLAALAKARQEPAFSIYICENGGAQAYQTLVAALTGANGLCSVADMAPPPAGGVFVRNCALKLAGGIDVFIGEARDNLGYAGGINACINHLLTDPEWTGLWVLNPDTEPQADALAELVAYSQKYNKGMVGSRIMEVATPDVIGSRGLSWSKWLCRTTGVDKFAPAAFTPDRLDVEQRIDSPHGASFYIKRDCLEKIGLMDEAYFLYFEDLDWGIRAKAASGLGYAFQSVVPHLGGTTIGSATRRSGRSQLAVYLDFRNRLLFVQRHYPGWLPWTAVVVLARAGEFLAVGAFKNFGAALSGWWAGLRGQTGRPENRVPRSV